MYAVPINLKEIPPLSLLVVSELKNDLLASGSQNPDLSFLIFNLTFLISVNWFVEMDELREEFVEELLLLT